MLVTSGLPVTAPVTRIIREAAPAQGADGSVPSGWSPLGRQYGLGRELSPHLHTRMVQQSFKAYRTNPMARRLIEMKTNFVLGNGITVTSTNPEVLAALSLWWNDPYNNWPARIQQRLRDLYIYGEWLHRPLIEEGTQFVRIADVQPDQIIRVDPDPYDHGVTEQVVLRQIVEANNFVTKDVAVPIIRRRLIPMSWKLEPTYSGSLFYFGINRTTDSIRGVGELFTLLDFIDLYDDMIYSRAEKIRAMSQVWFDLKITGMNEEQIREYISSVKSLPPRSGSLWAHNEQMEMKAQNANLQSDDNAIDASSLKSHIISTDGWPGTWFDDSAAGRASAAEMAEPSLRMIANLQAQVGQMILLEAQYHLEQIGVRGENGAQPEFSITFNKASAKDIQKIGPALARFGQYLTAINGIEGISHEELRQVIASQFNQLGLSDVPFSLELPADLVTARQDKADLAVAAAAAKAAMQNPDNPQGPQRPAAATSKKAESQALVSHPTLQAVSLLRIGI